MNARIVPPQEVRNFIEVPVRSDCFHQLQERRLALVHHRGVEQRKQLGRRGQHVAQPGYGIAADGHVDLGKLFLDHGAEGHRGKQLLPQHDGDADDLRLFFENGRLDDMLEHVAINVDLRILDRGQDLRRHEEFIRQVRFHRRHTNTGGRVDQ